MDVHISFYRAFHRFEQALFAYGGIVLGLSQFTLLPQLPLKTKLNSKVVKIEQKIIISLCQCKFVKYSVESDFAKKIVHLKK